VPLFLKRQRDRTLRQVRRIEERGKTSGRSDDNAEAMVKRLRVYHEETGPVIDHFDRLGQARPRRSLSKKRLNLVQAPKISKTVGRGAAPALEMPGRAT
jgi:adenylate kinase family enzyme